jgi:hypothetical protein
MSIETNEPLPGSASQTPALIQNTKNELINEINTPSWLVSKLKKLTPYLKWIVLSTLFFSCGPAIKEWKIVEKKYEPEEINSQRYLINESITYQPIVDDEDFIFTIEWKDAEWKTITQEFYVGKDVYTIHKEWDHFVVGDKGSRYDF